MKKKLIGTLLLIIATVASLALAIRSYEGVNRKLSVQNNTLNAVDIEKETGEETGSGFEQ